MLRLSQSSLDPQHAFNVDRKAWSKLVFCHPLLLSQDISQSHSDGDALKSLNTPFEYFIVSSGSPHVNLETLHLTGASVPFLLLSIFLA